MAGEIRKRSVQKVAVKLTDEELLRYGKALAQTESDLKALEGEHDARKSLMKQELAEIGARRSMLSGLVSSGEEVRDVECEDVFTYSDRKVARVRVDTGEIIFERPMTAEESQRSFLGDL